MTKYSGLTGVSSGLATHEWGVNEAGASKKINLGQVKTYVGTGLSNASLTTVSAAYAVDTYLAGSSVTIPTAGGWVAGSFYRCTFDMTKTAAGTVGFAINVRMGTAGTTADPVIATVTFAGGTAAADLGVFSVIGTFRSVGAGTAAVLRATASLVHTLTLSGLTSNNVAGATSAGFNSTTQTKIGLSINGGTSFSGTNETVVATLDKYQ